MRLWKSQKPFICSLLLLGILLPTSSAFAVNFNLGEMMTGFFDASGSFGDGASGALTVNSNAPTVGTGLSGYPYNGKASPLVVNTLATRLNADAAKGATSLTVVSSTSFAAGDNILIIGMDGVNAGKMQFTTISSIGSGTNIVIPSPGLYNAYSSTTTAGNYVQILRVPRYTNVTINSGAVISANAYNASTGTGGVVAFKVSGTLTLTNASPVSGSVSMGSSYITNTSYDIGFAGGSAAAGSGPGGGASAATSNGGTNMSPGVGTNLIMGAGGGAPSGGVGGVGGGIVIVKAAAVSLGGTITANGRAGSGTNAGGGAGGTVALFTNTLSCSSGAISATAGAATGTGSAGSVGRVFVNYTTTLGCQPGTTTTTYQKMRLK